MSPPAGSVLKSCPGKVDVTSSSPKMPQASHGSVVYLDSMDRPPGCHAACRPTRKTSVVFFWDHGEFFHDSLVMETSPKRCLTIFCIFLAWRQRHLICLMLRLLVKQDRKAWSIHLLNFNKRMYFQVLQKSLVIGLWARLQHPNLYCYRDDYGSSIESPKNPSGIHSFRWVKLCWILRWYRLVSCSYP